ncbi:DNA recombination protein RmuC [Arcobacter sp. KX21116]|uniref:DNA recombination protein RmuC n=1 Tax=Arcobacter iocasae TaxID=2906515 RepID=UPI0035D5131A
MENFEVLVILFSAILVIGGFLFYKTVKDKNTEIKDVSKDKQNLEIKNSELTVSLDNSNNIKDLYNESSKQLEEKKQESNQFKEDLTKTKALLDEQINKYNAFEKSQTERVDDLKNENIQLKESNENKFITIGQLKEDLSKYKTSFEEQKENNTKQSAALNKRIEELKDETQALKVTNSDYNEQIKNYKSMISKLETKVNESVQNTKKTLTDKESYINDLKQTINTLSDDKEELQIQVNKDKGIVSQLQTQLEEQHKAMEDKVKLLQNSEEKLKVEFENLATKIFTDNSKKFSEQNQKDLGLILNPMKAQLIDFKKKVEDVYDKEAKDRSLLSAELKTLKELNQKMSAEAHNLTNALRSDSKKQGKWGEMVLEKVLESSGLREGHEFKREVSLKDDENKPFRPDVIVYLPDNRHIIIDAKTSLTAYNDYMAEEDDTLKQIYLKNHIKSVKDHIKGLANKKYEDLQNVNSLDFIFMFVPIEGALLLALDNDVNLYDEAFKQKIILVSPTTLLVALRAVENTWRYERQAQNIADVYKRAEELYKKFTGFVDDLKKVDEGLGKARKSYDEAFKKLSTGPGNLVGQVIKLKKVSNIKPKKELDTVLVDVAMMDVLENKSEDLGE